MEKEDVNEAMRLMEMSKDSLATRNEFTRLTSVQLKKIVCDLITEIRLCFQIRICNGCFVCVCGAMQDTEHHRSDICRYQGHVVDQWSRWTHAEGA